MLTLLLGESCQKASSQDVSNDEIEFMLKDFYGHYIRECNKVPNSLSNIDAILERFCTKNLRNQIKNNDLDYDPLLKAQYCDPNWLKTLNVSKDITLKNVFFVSYQSIINNHKNETKIRLLILKQDGVYKIDKVFI
jgi:hypothetical protein